MKVTTKELRMMILEESRKLLREEDNPVTATSSGDMRRERRIPVVNMKRLRRTDREIADWMERDNPELRGKSFGPIDRYNQAVQELNADVSAANSPVEVMETENVPDEAVPSVEVSMGILDIPIPHYVTTSESDKWNYKVVDDVWYTQKKDDLNRTEDADDTDDWISLGGDRENFVKASKKLDMQFGDIRSQSAREETEQQHTANQADDDDGESDSGGTAQARLEVPRSGTSSGHSTASGISDRDTVNESAVRRWGKLAGLLKG